MSLHHARSGEVIQLRPFDPKLPDTISVALLKSSHLEVMHLVLAAGKSMPEHHVPGEMTLQCLEGTLEVSMPDKVQTLRAGEMLFLAGDVRHGLHALEHTSALMTLVLLH